MLKLLLLLLAAAAAAAVVTLSTARNGCCSSHGRNRAHWFPTHLTRRAETPPHTSRRNPFNAIQERKDTLSHSSSTAVFGETAAVSDFAGGWC